MHSSQLPNSSRGCDLLRTGAGSEVHLNTLQFERGSADQLLDADARAGAGGCVNSLGALVLQNVAMRNCKAVNGGALASEGGLEASKSVFTHNVARHCGGGVDVALRCGERGVNSVSSRLQR
mmetsp:Transcript_20593/g.66917  ORF Transcript_20593/g.66917 Transcript_20593/m.66917 type:complete len:122 (-) Transcript_20593:530-895(-)